MLGFHLAAGEEANKSNLTFPVLSGEKLGEEKSPPPLRHLLLIYPLNKSFLKVLSSEI
jgi:hypothetical protein